MNFADNISATFGDANDMLLYHDGTTNYIKSDNGGIAMRVANGNRLEINGTSGDVIMQGSGGKNFTWDTSAGYLNLNDNARLTLGTSNDFFMYHNGSNTIFDQDGTGNLFFQVGGNNKFYTQSGGAQFVGSLYGDDSNKIELGSSQDFQIYHDGTSNIFQSSGLKNFIFRPKDTDVGLKIIGDGGVELYHDNTKMLETISTGTNIPDGKFAKFGNSNDMSMGHNTYNYITYTGADFLLTGDATNQIKLQPKSDEPALICKPNAEVELYYNALVQAETQDGGFRIRGKNYTCHQAGDMDSTVNMKVCFYQLIAASGSHTFQAGSTYSMGTVTIHGSRGTPANNATLATGKIFPIHVRAGATAGLGSQIGSDLGGASGGFSYSVAAASQGITVTNSSSSYAMKCFVTFDLTGFV